MSQISGEEKSSKTAVLFAIVLTVFFVSFSIGAINIALPAIGNEFNASAVELGWIMSSFTLSSAIFLLPFGKLGDIFGRKRIFSTGIILFTISVFLIVFSQNFAMMILFRAIQGFASAMIFATSMAIITAVFNPGERGRAFGINVTAVYLGFVTGPFLGGLLTQFIGWRSIFIVTLPFLILSCILIKIKINIEWADAAGEKFDWKGSLTYGFAMFALMYGISILPSPMGWVSLAAGLLLAALFVFIELRVKNPVFEFSLIFNNKAFAFASSASLLIYAATNALPFFTSLYLQYLKGFDARVAGLIMMSQPLAMTLMAPVAGKLSDKKNPGLIASVGIGIVSFGLILLCFINENTPIPYLIALLALVGAGFGIFSAPNQNALMSSVEKKHLGIASGTLGTARSIGQMMGMSAAMMLLLFYTGTEPINPSTFPALISAIRTGFLIFAVFSALGTFVSLARK